MSTHIKRYLQTTEPSARSVSMAMRGCVNIKGSVTLPRGPTHWPPPELHGGVPSQAGSTACASRPGALCVMGILCLYYIHRSQIPVHHKSNAKNN